MTTGWHPNIGILHFLPSTIEGPGIFIVFQPLTLLSMHYVDYDH